MCTDGANPQRKTKKNFSLVQQKSIHEYANAALQLNMANKVPTL
jgi:hypothetical protein